MKYVRLHNIKQLQHHWKEKEKLLKFGLKLLITIKVVVLVVVVVVGGGGGGGGGGEEEDGQW